MGFSSIDIQKLIDSDELANEVSKLDLLGIQKPNKKELAEIFGHEREVRNTRAEFLRRCVGNPVPVLDRKVFDFLLKTRTAVLSRIAKQDTNSLYDFDSLLSNKRSVRVVGGEIRIILPTKFEKITLDLISKSNLTLEQLVQYWTNVGNEFQKMTQMVVPRIITVYINGDEEVKVSRDSGIMPQWIFTNPQ